jgi:hypothetical protein
MGREGVNREGRGLAPGFGPAAHPFRSCLAQSVSQRLSVARTTTKTFKTPVASNHRCWTSGQLVAPGHSFSGRTSASTGGASADESVSGEAAGEETLLSAFSAFFFFFSSSLLRFSNW